jgi:WD40 repeat protein
LLVTRRRDGLRSWFPPIPFPLDFDVQSRKDKNDSINSAKFNACGDLVVTTSNTGKVRVWNLENEKKNETKFLPLQGYTVNVRYAEFSPDGRFVIAAANDGAARIWNLEQTDYYSSVPCTDTSKMNKADARTKQSR